MPRGLLFRSVELGRLDPQGLASLARLGIRTVYDLRTEPERTAEPDRLPPGVRGVALDVMADADNAALARLRALLEDPRRATEELGGGKAIAAFQHGYRQMVTLPSALTAYRALYTSLTEDANRPALIHCTTGKDRTGWGAAALLMLLGVGDEDVRRDYLLTNVELLPALEPLFDAFTAQGGDPDILNQVLGVRAEYLAAALEAMHARFGTIEGYFADGLGIDAAGQHLLLEVFGSLPG